MRQDRRYQCTGECCRLMDLLKACSCLVLIRSAFPCPNDHPLSLLLRQFGHLASLLYSNYDYFCFLGDQNADFRHFALHPTSVPYRAHGRHAWKASHPNHWSDGLYCQLRSCPMLLSCPPPLWHVLTKLWPGCGLLLRYPHRRRVTNCHGGRLLFEKWDLSMFRLNKSRSDCTSRMQNLGGRRQECVFRRKREPESRVISLVYPLSIH